MPQFDSSKLAKTLALLLAVIFSVSLISGLSATFSRYEAKRSYSIAVVADNFELINLRPLQEYSYISEDGKLYIDISTANPNWNENRGKGLSPSSKYAFNGVFEVSNDLWEGICINVTITSDIPELKTYYRSIENASSTTHLALNPGERAEIGLLVETLELGRIEGTLKIHAERCNGFVPTPTPTPEETPTPTPTPEETPTPLPQNFEILVELPQRVPKGDIVFLFDVTGSMSEELEQAKKSAVDLMNSIRGLIPDSYFGVCSMADYPEFYNHSENYGYGFPYVKYYGYLEWGDYPWREDSDLIYDINVVASIINSLELKRGGDEAEPYGYAIHKTANEISWREGTKKIIVVLGDAPPHNMPDSGLFANNYGGDPGDDWIMNTSDDIVYSIAIQSAGDAGISIISIFAGRNDEYLNDARTNFQHMAQTTNGAYAELTDVSQLPSIIENKIREVAEQPIGNLTLIVNAPSGWSVTWSPEKYTNVNWGSSVTFSIQVTPPEPHNPETITIEVLADGIVIQTHQIQLS